MPHQSFADLGVSRAVAGALAENGITEPFAIQKLVIADVLAGHDVLAMSPTGSGKTIAFGAPIADRIEAGDRRPAALILAPTRELTAQIVDDLRPMAQARALKIASVYGGVGIVKQAREAAHAHIVVATPGPPRGPPPARRAEARPRADPRPRRGRSHARHGLPPRRRPDRGPVPARPPDAVLLGHARRRGRHGRQALHARRAPPRAHPDRHQHDRDRAPLPRRRARRAHRRAARRAARRARPRAGLRAHQARRRPAGQAPQPRGRQRRRDARRQVPGPARARAGELRDLRRRHPRGHRRRRARHRRRRASRTSSTSTRPPTATATCTASGAPAAPGAPAWA